jgi:hypothetical protein
MKTRKIPLFPGSVRQSTLNMIELAHTLELCGISIYPSTCSAGSDGRFYVYKIGQYPATYYFFKDAVKDAVSIACEDGPLD